MLLYLMQNILPERETLHRERGRGDRKRREEGSEGIDTCSHNIVTLDYHVPILQLLTATKVHVSFSTNSYKQIMGMKDVATMHCRRAPEL